MARAVIGTSAQELARAYTRFELAREVLRLGRELAERESSIAKMMQSEEEGWRYGERCD